MCKNIKKEIARVDTSGGQCRPPSTSRRRFLAGVGAGVVGAGVISDSARAAADGTAGERVTDDPFEDPEELEAFVDEVMRERIGDEVAGATISVVDSDKTVLEKEYGYADIDADRPVDAQETVFRVGSVAKLVTWTAVMQGIEDGRLDLDADVNSYLEDSTVEVSNDYDERVTLRHLGTHTAGFDYALNPGVTDDEGDITSLEEALVENQPERVRPPGEVVEYSNYGAMLAAHVIEEAYDTTFEEYVRSEIFDPLDMDHSTFAQPVPDDHPGELAEPHSGTDGEFAVEDDIYINWRPAGSLETTAADMAAFMGAHLGGGAFGGGRILDADTTKEMHAQHFERHPEVNNWRYGFHEQGQPDANVIAHSGGAIHFTSHLALSLDHEVGIFVAYNVRNERSMPGEVIDEIIDEFDLQPEADDPVPTTEQGSVERAEQVVGEYSPTIRPETGPEQVLGVVMAMSVEADGEEIVTNTVGEDERRWIETEPYVYRSVEDHDVLVFDVEDDTVQRAHQSNAPTTTFEPTPFIDRQIVSGGGLSASLLVFVLSAVGWTGRGAWRRSKRYRSDDGGHGNRDGVKEVDGGGEEFDDDDDGGVASADVEERVVEGSKERARSPEYLSRAAGAGLCAASLAFVGLLVAAFAAYEDLVFALDPLSLQMAFTSAYLVALFAIGTVVGTVLAWKNGYWSLGARLHQTLLAVAGVVFVALLGSLGLL